MNYIDRYQQWCNADVSSDVLAELSSIKNDSEELKSRFLTDLQFGTAGMRGVMGAGSNRLNKYTVRRAAQGMALWLSGTDLPQRAAIGYDSRHNSKLFAEVCAVAFAEAGIYVYLFDRLAPTPMLSYAVRALGCGCGIVISASHNSGEYNGVKCYGPDGCQMTDEPAKIVTEKIAQIPYFMPEEKSFCEFIETGLIHYIDNSVWEDYYQVVKNEAIAPEIINEANLHIVYTPLCGTGNEPVRRVLGDLGAKITVVSCQEQPDGDFKTCEYPNPETDAALLESYKMADKTGCDLILGTDPDCDRVAIAVPDGNCYKKLTGNELGCLMLEYILSALKNKEALTENSVVVRSIVSSSMADKIAETYGASMQVVLTGFKYIGGVILGLEEQGRERDFVFGFEESCGYLKGTYARDKDAVVASMLVCELAAHYKTKGMTILDALNRMYEKYGYYLASVKSLELSGADAMEKAAMLMADLRENTPVAIGEHTVTCVNDYKSGISKNLESGFESHIALPKSNVLEYILGEYGSVIVRPSGTEPKVKFYYTSVGDTYENAEHQINQYIKHFS